MTKLHNIGYSHARMLILDGQVKNNEPWPTNTAEKQSPEWFLGIDDKSLEYPISKDSMVYRDAIVVAQLGPDEIKEHADKLLKLIDDTKAQLSINDENEILFYGVLGWEDTAKELINLMKESAKVQDRVTLRIDSPGGNFSQSLAVYNYMTTFHKPIDVIIDGMARSAAGLIACGGNITMYGSSVFHMHNPSNITVGDYKDAQEAANLLEKFSNLAASVYARKSGRSLREVRQWMDDDTYFTAQEAFDVGLCDDVINPAVQMSSVYFNLIKRSKDMTVETKVKKALDDLKLMVDDKGITQICTAVGSAFEDENKTLKAKVVALGKTNVIAKLTTKVGKEPAILLGKVQDSVTEDSFKAIVDMVVSLQKTITELGGPKGDPESKLLPSSDDVVLKKVVQIAKDENMSETDALALLAERDPELIANWK